MTTIVKVRMADGSVQEVEVTQKVYAALQDKRLGDDGTVFFQRQLEAIEAQTYDTLYADLEARGVFPTNTFGGAGATSLTYRSFNKVGRARVINARAVDLPKSDISAFETRIPVRSVGVAYDFDIDEIAAAQMAGLPLEARKAMAARRGYEQYVERTVWNGDAAAGLGGLFDNNFITKSNVAKAWDTATEEEILAQLNGMVAAMYASTLKVHKPDTLLLPVAKYMYIRSKARSINSDKTILQFFLENNGFVSDVRPINAITGKGESGAECAVLISWKSPEGLQNVRIREPLPLVFQPVQLHGLVYEVPGRGRFAGLEITYPAAIAVWSGI